MKLRYLVMGILMLSLSQCYDDSEEELYPTLEVCKETNISFADDIMPMINGSCIACHGSNAAQDGGGISLLSHAEISASKANILKSISPGASTPMPKGTMGMDKCAVQQFNAWINEGALNN